MKKEKEILREQLQLLAEESKISRTDELGILSKAISIIHNELLKRYLLHTLTSILSICVVGNSLVYCFVLIKKHFG